jgi:hypothetical protein
MMPKIRARRVKAEDVLNRSGLIILSKRRPSAYRHFVDSATDGLKGSET